VGGLVPVRHFVGAQRNVVPKGHKITGKRRHKSREQPHQRPYNAHAERRQGIAYPQHQQKFPKEEHCVHRQRADEQIDQLPSGKGFRVAVHDAQQDGGSHFQQSHQQNFQQAKGGFARKQAAALLQGVEELWHTAFDLDLPQAAGKHGHQHRHQNGLDDRDAVKQGTVTVGQFFRVRGSKPAHP